MLIAACSFIAGALINVDVWLAGNAAPARTNTESSETKITSPSPFHRTPAGRRKTPHPSAAFASDGHITREYFALLIYFIYSGLAQINSSHLLLCPVAKLVRITPEKQLLSSWVWITCSADKFPHPLDYASQPQRRVMQRSDTPPKMRLKLLRTRLVTDLRLRSQMTQQQWEYKVTARSDRRFASTTCCDTWEGSGISSPDLSHDLWPQGPSGYWMLTMLMWLSTDEIRDISNEKINLMTDSNLNWSLVAVLIRFEK